MSVLDDDEENRITVGSVVTVDVEITRNPLMVRGSRDLSVDHVILQECEVNDGIAEEEEIVANEVVGIVTIDHVIHYMLFYRKQFHLQWNRRMRRRRLARLPKLGKSQKDGRKELPRQRPKVK